MELEEEETKNNVEQEDNTPPVLSCLSTVLDLDYHPKAENLLCCSLVTGHIEVWQNSSTKIAVVQGLHQGESCRTIAFGKAGDLLFSGGADGGLHGIDANRGEVMWTSKRAHDVSVNRVSTCVTNDVGHWCLLSGDEEGQIKLWDIREPNQKKAARLFPDTHCDYVSDFSYSEDHKRVISTSGDGTIGVFDLRKASRIKSEARSGELETELLSSLLIKNGKRLVCGTQEGNLAIWTWGHWDGPSDFLTGHPLSVDCLLKVTEDVILTGSSDGIVRIVRVHPNKLLGVIGFHDDFPVERMVYLPNKRMIATCSHDNLVRFWDTGFLIDGMDELDEIDFDVRQEATDSNDDDNDDETNDDERSSRVNPPRKRGKKDKNKLFFEDL